MKKFIILLILITNCAFLRAPENSNYYTKEFIENTFYRIEKERIYFDLYKEVLIKLKEFEGLRLVAYKDTHGMAIGYGHQIKKYEKIPTVITEEFAEAMLRIDFEYAISVVEKQTGFDRYKEPNKVLALANFVFNLGSGSFQNSTMLKNIKHNIPIDNEITRWNKMKVGGSYVVSSHLKMRRSYELQLYNNIT